MGDFPEDVKRFVLEAINSVYQLEALLLLRQAPDKTFSVAEVGQALYTPPEAIEEKLAEFLARGVLQPAEGPQRLYRYAPRDAALAAVIDRLAETYKQRRVAVISLIYSKPQDQVQAFADAFRLRKEK